VGEEFTQADKTAMAAMFNMVMLLHEYANRRIKQAVDYEDIFDSFDKEAFTIMKDRNYWSESDDDDEAVESSQQQADGSHWTGSKRAKVT
jgi:hypothetical protein